MRHPTAIALIGAALTLTLPLLARPVQADTSDFQEQRQLMRQVTQQLQSRLDQRLRCLNQARSFSDLETCQRLNSTGWHHGPGMGGPGMGGWGCPMW